MREWREDVLVGPVVANTVVKTVLRLESEGGDFFEGILGLVPDCVLSESVSFLSTITDSKRQDRTKRIGQETKDMKADSLNPISSTGCSFKSCNN